MEMERQRKRSKNTQGKCVKEVKYTRKARKRKENPKTGLGLLGFVQPRN